MVQPRILLRADLFHPLATLSLPSQGFKQSMVAPYVANLNLLFNNGGEKLRLTNSSSVEVDFRAWAGGDASCGAECVGWDIMGAYGQYLVRTTPNDTDSPNDWARVASQVIPKAGRPSCGTPSCTFPDTLTITAVDIGQGDMSLVATPTKFLIGDTGESTWKTASIVIPLMHGSVDGIAIPY